MARSNDQSVRFDVRARTPAVLVQRELNNPPIVLSNSPPRPGRGPWCSSLPPAGVLGLGSGTARGFPTRLSADSMTAMRTTSAWPGGADDALHERLRACDHVLRGSPRPALRACLAAPHSRWHRANALCCSALRSRLRPAGRHQASTASTAECTPSSTTCASVRSSRCFADSTAMSTPSGASHFRGHLCVCFRYGPVTRNHPEDGFVDGLQVIGLPPPCHPSYGASGSYPGGTDSH